jgi:hypothetical protein
MFSDRSKRTAAQSILSAVIGAGLVLGAPAAAMAEDYIPDVTHETVTPAPTPIPPKPAQTIQQAPEVTPVQEESILAATGLSAGVWLVAGAAVAVILVGGVLVWLGRGFRNAVGSTGDDLYYD